MFGRGIFLILAIAVAFATPYFLSDRPLDQQTGLYETRWWDSLWGAEAGREPYPIAAVSPLPTASSLDRVPTDMAAPGNARQPQDRTIVSTTRGMSDQTALLPYPAQDVASSSVVAPPAQSSPSSDQPSSPYPRPFYPPGVSPPPGSVESSGVGPPDAEGWVTVRTWGAPDVPDGGNGNQSVAQPLPATDLALPTEPAAVPLPRLEELFHFNIQPDWITYYWPRVSADLLRGDLAGMRVPLVSGTEPHDLAGSLSYYFDRDRLLQRIDFQGSTGDPRYLIRVVQSQYQLQAVPSLGGGLFLTGDATQLDTITSALRIRQAPVIRESEPLRRYSIQLELNRPGTDRRLSREFVAILRDDAKAKRWVPGQRPATTADPEARQLTGTAPQPGARLVYTPARGTPAVPPRPTGSPPTANLTAPQPMSAPPPTAFPSTVGFAPTQGPPRMAPRQPG